MQDEFYLTKVLPFMDNGIMDFFQFVKFLEAFDLFDDVEEIEDLYLDLKIKESSCDCRRLRFIRPFSDDNSRL